MYWKPIGGVAPLLTQQPLGYTKVAPRTLIMIKKSSFFSDKWTINVDSSSQSRCLHNNVTLPLASQRQ